MRMKLPFPSFGNSKTPERRSAGWLARRRARKLRSGAARLGSQLERLEDRRLLAIVGLYNDPAYVDEMGTADSAETALAALGHDVVPIAPAPADSLAWQIALNGKEVLVIPELTANLNGDLTNSPVQRIQTFLNGGGRAIVLGTVSPNAANVVGRILATPTIQSWGMPLATQSTLQASAAGTPFDGGPNMLASHEETTALQQPSLPAGSQVAYAALAAEATVVWVPFGSGAVAYLGWNWAGVNPLEADWLDVLDRAVAGAAGATDTTPPTIVATIDPNPNAAGWNNSDPTVTFVCSDESGVASCTSPQTVTTEGAGQMVRGIATDNAGNTATIDVVVNLDKTPPRTTGQLDPPPNANGYNITPVDLTLLAADGLSGATRIDVSIDGGPVFAYAGPIHFDQDGTFSVLVAARDLAGNLEPAQTFVVRVDRAPPASPTLDLASSSDSGSSDSDNVTRHTELVVQGTAEAGVTVDLFAGGVFVGSAITVAGSWTVTTGTFAEGQHVLTARATDAAGNTSTLSGPLVVVIDTMAPATPAAPDLDSASDSGVSNSDDITNQAVLIFNTFVQAGEKAQLFRDGLEIKRSDVAVATGPLSIQTDPNPAGRWCFQLRVEDAAGNLSDFSGETCVTVDLQAPLVGALDLDAGSDSGRSPADNITNVATATIHFTAEPDSQVEFYVNGALDDGTYTPESGVDFSRLMEEEGIYYFFAIATDVAGNRGAPSAILAVTFDETAPPTPAAPDLAAESDTGVSSTDNITNDTTPTLTGTAEAGASVEVFANGLLLGIATADAAMAWTFTSIWLPGTYVVEVAVVDAAGNASGLSPDLTVTVDTTPPVTPAAPDLDSASDSGVSDSDNITNHTMLTLTGIAGAGAALALRIGQEVVVDFLEGDPDQPVVLSFVWNAAADVPAGSSENVRLTLIARDVAGNEGPASAPTDVIVDRSPPVVLMTGQTPTNDRSPRVVVLAVDDIGLPSTVTAFIDLDSDGDGVFTGSELAYQIVPLTSALSMIDLSPPLTAGTYSSRIRLTGFAGNEGISQLFTFVIGNDPPQVATGGPYVGRIGDAVTFDFSGTTDDGAEAGETLAMLAADFNGDGIPDVVTASRTPTVDWATLAALTPALHIADPGTGLPTNPIEVRITDSLGAVGTAMTTLTIYDNRPVAAIAADSSTVGCDVTIGFSAARSSHGDPNRAIVKYEWDFDYNAGAGFAVDAVTGGTPSVTHTYLSRGAHTTAVRVTDDNTPAKQSLSTVDVTVDFDNLPSVVAGRTETVDNNETITIHAMASEPNAPCDSIASYGWDLDNDGQFDDATGESVTVTPAQSAALGWRVGSNLVNVQVRDSFGASTVGEITVIVFDNRPIPVLIVTPNPASAGQMVTFDASASSHGRPDRVIVSYGWDFNGDDVYDVVTAGATTSHVYAQGGTFSPRVTVTDNNVPARTDSATVSLTVTEGTLEPPGVPVLSITSPGSPSNDPQPEVRGTAAAGSQVHVYVSEDCDDAAPATVVTADADGLFSAMVDVAPNTITYISARALDSDLQASGCSRPISYRHDDIPPAAPTDMTAIVVDPSDPSGNTIFVASASGGVWVTVHDEPTCTSLPLVAALADSAGNVRARAIVPRHTPVGLFAAAHDEAGNYSICAAGPTITLNDAPPAVEIQSVGFGGRPLRGRVPVTVAVTDDEALPEDATIALDVDLNNDNDFDDAGEMGYVTTTLGSITPEGSIAEDGSPHTLTFDGSQYLEVLSWSFGVSQPGTGGTTEGEMTIKKAIDKASPDLFLAALGGKKFDTVTLTSHRANADQQEKYLQITLHDVLITSVGPGSSLGDDRPTEQISFNYTKIEWNYTEQKPNGQKETHTGTYDLPKATAATTPPPTQSNVPAGGGSQSVRFSNLEHEIEAQSLTFELQAPTGGAGLPTGSTATIMLPIGAHSASLLAAATNGARIATVVYRPPRLTSAPDIQGPQSAIVLEDVFITGYQIGSAESSSRPVDTLSLNFGRVIYEHVGPDQGAVAGGVDLRNGKWFGSPLPEGPIRLASPGTSVSFDGDTWSGVKSTSFDVTVAPSTGRLSSSGFSLVMDAGASTPGLLAAIGGAPISTVVVRQHQMIDGQLVLVTEYMLHDVHVTKVEHSTMTTADGVSATQTVMLDPGRVTVRHYRQQAGGGTTTTEFTYDFATGNSSGPGTIQGSSQPQRNATELSFDGGNTAIALDGFKLDLSTDPVTGRLRSSGLTATGTVDASTLGALDAAAAGRTFDGVLLNRYQFIDGQAVLLAQYMLDGVRVTGVSHSSTGDGSQQPFGQTFQLMFDRVRIRTFKTGTGGAVETIETTVDLVTGQSSGPLTVRGNLSVSGAEKTLSLDGETAFEVDDVSLEVSPDLATGHPKLVSFIGVKPLDSLSPRLMLACANGEHIPKVVFTIHREEAGVRDAYLRYELTDVVISSIHLDTDSDGGLVEVVRFIPRTLKVAQIGTLATGNELIEAEIDFATGEVSGPDDVVGSLFQGDAPITASVNGNQAFALKSFQPRLSTATQVGEVTVRGWDPVKVTKIVDKATPALFAACCRTETVGDSLKIFFVRSVADTTGPYLTYTLENTLVSSYSVSGQGAGDPIPTESISFNFERIRIVYQDYDSQGRPAGVQIAQWDVALGGQRQVTLDITVPDAGPYAVRGRLFADSSGQTGISDTKTFTVEVGNLVPTADAGLDRVIRVNETVTLDGTGSVDPNGGAISLYEWDTNYDGVTFDVDAVGPVVTNYRNENWPFEGGGTLIALRVTDPEGASHIALSKLTFLDESPPEVVLVAPPVTNTTTPVVTVEVSDNKPLPVGTPVVLNVDLNNDGDFADPGELGHTTATLDEIALPDGDIGLNDALATLSIGGLGAIEVESWSWGETNTGSHAMPPGSAKINVTVDTSRASPGLVLATLEGRHFQDAVLTIHRRVEDRNEPYMQLVLENTLISGYSISSGGDRPTESLSLNFTKIQLGYTTSRFGSGPRQTVDVSHNFQANRGSSTAASEAITGDIAVDGALQTASFDGGQTAVEVLGFHWGVSQTATGITANQATLVKRIDSSSPLLFATSAQGKPVPAVSVNLHGIVHNGRVETMQVTFTDVLISSVRPSGQGGESLPLEEVSFNYNKFEIKYKETRHDYTVQYRETDFDFATRQGSSPQTIEGSLASSTDAEQAISLDGGATWIEIASFDWGGDRAASVGGPGPEMEDIHMTMITNKATPQLMLACATGRHIPSGIITVRRSVDGQPQEYLKIKFSDLLVSSFTAYSAAFPAGLWVWPGEEWQDYPMPTDQVSFNFSKVEVEYLEQAADGTTQLHEAEYDFVAAQGSGPQQVSGNLAVSDAADHTLSFDDGASFVAVSNIEWGVTGGGGGSGAVADSLTFDMKVNQASPALMIAAAKGKLFPSVVLRSHKTVDGQPQVYLIVTMTDVLVTSYQTGGSGGDVVPTDQVSLNFSKIEFEYKERKDDGTIHGHSVQYDFHDGVGSGPLVITGNLEHAEEADEKYISFDGGVSGFEIKDFSFGVENPTTIGSATGGVGAGKIKFNEFNISKASPALIFATATGRHIPAVRLTLNRTVDGRREPYLIITMTDLVITSYRSESDDNDVPSAELLMNYSQVKYEYIEQKADGSRKLHMTEFNFDTDQGTAPQEITGELEESDDADATLTLDGRDSWIEVNSFSWGATQTGSHAGGGGGGAGKVSMQDIHFTTKISKATPELMLACASGEHIPDAVLTLHRTVEGRREEYLKIKFSDLLVSSYQTDGGGGGGGVPTEQFSLNFSKIEFKYTPQKPDGTLDAAKTARYDHETGQTTHAATANVPLPAGAMYRLQAQVADAAGNVGTSAVQTTTVATGGMIVASIEPTPTGQRAHIMGTGASDDVSVEIFDGKLNVRSSAGVVAGPGFTPVNATWVWWEIESVDPHAFDLFIDLGTADDTVDFTAAEQFPYALTVDGGEGSDSFRIRDDDANRADGVYSFDPNGTVRLAFGSSLQHDGVETLSLNTGDRNDTINVNLTAQSALSTLIINGEGGDDVFDIVFSNKALLKLFGDAGNDEFLVRATSVGTTTEVNGGTENDIITIGSATTGLDDILGRVSVDGGDHDASPTTELTIGGVTNRTRTGNLVVFDDTPRPLDRHYFISDFYVQREMTVFDLSRIQTLTLNTGAGNDTTDVVTTAASSNTTINTGGGSDTITIHNTGAASNVVVNSEGQSDVAIFKAAAADGLLLVNTGDGNDTFTVDSTDPGNNENWNFGSEHVLVNMGQNEATPVKTFVAGGRTVSVPVGDTLILDDADKTAPGDYFFGDGSVRRNITILLSDGVESFSAFAGANSDSFSLGDTSFRSITVDGAGGNDRLTVSGTPGNIRTILDGTSNTLMIGERPPLSFTGLEKTLLAGMKDSDIIIDGNLSVYSEPASGGTDFTLEQSSDGSRFTFIQEAGLPSVLTTTGRVEVVGDGGQGTAGGGMGGDVDDTIVFTGTGTNAATLTLNTSPPIDFRNVTVARISSFEGSNLITVAPFATSTRDWGVDLIVAGGGANSTLVYLDVVGRSTETRLVPTGVHRGHIDAAGVASLVSDQVLAFANIGNIELAGNAGDGDRLTLNGTAASDQVAVAFTPSQSTVRFTGGASMTVRATNYDSLQFNGHEGSDTFTLDLTFAPPDMPAPFRVNGGDPIGLMPGDVLEVISGAQPVTYKPGPQNDEGGVQIGAGAAVSYEQVEMTSIRGAGAASPPPILFATAGDDQITIVDSPGGAIVTINGGSVTEVTSFPAIRLDALAGNDRIVVASSQVELIGSDGDDVIELQSSTFQRIDAGGGFDTLRLEVVGHSLDLTSLAPGALGGVEQIDLSGAGANTLVLNAQRIRELSDTDTLRVRADAEDRVYIGSGWTVAGLRLEADHLFSVFTQGGATLLVTNPLIGDQDGDQVVTRTDLVRLLARFGASTGVDRTSGDLNGDGRADIFDLALLQQNLGRQGIVVFAAEPGAPAPVVIHAAASSASEPPAAPQTARPSRRLATRAVDRLLAEAARTAAPSDAVPSLRIRNRRSARAHHQTAPATDQAFVDLPIRLRSE